MTVEYPEYPESVLPVYAVVLSIVDNKNAKPDLLPALEGPWKADKSFNGRKCGQWNPAFVNVQRPSFPGKSFVSNNENYPLPHYLNSLNILVAPSEGVQQVCHKTVIRKKISVQTSEEEQCPDEHKVEALAEILMQMEPEILGMAVQSITQNSLFYLSPTSIGWSPGRRAVCGYKI
ncbi:hypothetical protein RRG08_006458 [Elysia crispata]|uniref:Uncharacterized protein n=1 Tax=Elysia crispata TaxID=231223 RepID=A0AAE0YB03_9GAST|nr:hypothetical protein RRG08_006458 [Elysia crispata]